MTVHSLWNYLTYFIVVRLDKKIVSLFVAYNPLMKPLNQMDCY